MSSSHQAFKEQGALTLKNMQTSHTLVFFPTILFFLSKVSKLFCHQALPLLLCLATQEPHPSPKRAKMPLPVSSCLSKNLRRGSLKPARPIKTCLIRGGCSYSSRCWLHSAPQQYLCCGGGHQLPPPADSSRALFASHVDAAAGIGHPCSLPAAAATPGAAGG